MKRHVAALLLTTLCTSATAAPAPEQREVTAKVLDTATSYAGAIACSVSDITASDIVALRPYTSWDNRGDAEYLVFWEGDIGCLGGSRTSSFNVTSVMISIGDSYPVDLAKSAPAIHIEASIGAKLIRHSGDTLHLETREYAEDDASCCPSLARRVVLKRDAKGNWAEAE